jgi:hypothetical protein
MKKFDPPLRRLGTTSEAPRPEVGCLLNIGNQFTPPAIPRVHEGGGLAARTPGVLTLKAEAGPRRVGPNDGK